MQILIKEQRSTRMHCGVISFRVYRLFAMCFCRFIPCSRWWSHQEFVLQKWKAAIAYGLLGQFWKAWNERETALGIDKKTSIEFADALLHSISKESKKESSSLHLGDSQMEKRLQSIASLIPYKFMSDLFLQVKSTSEIQFTQSYIGILYSLSVFWNTVFVKRGGWSTYLLEA